MPISSMRRTIGKRLLDSKQQIPHYYLTVEINMGERMTRRTGAQLMKLDRINKLREMFNKAGEGKTKLSVNDFSGSRFVVSSSPADLAQS